MGLIVGRIRSAFDDDSQAVAFINTMTGGWSQVSFRASTSEGGPMAFSPEMVQRRSKDDDSTIDHALEVLSSHIKNVGELTNEVAIVAEFEGTGMGVGSVSYAFEGRPAENHGVDLEFGDGSAATVLPRDDPLIDDPEDDVSRTRLPADHPARLSEPITVDEYGMLEGLINELDKLVDSAENDETRLRVEGAIGVLRGSHRAAVADETVRRDLVPAVREVVRFLGDELPKKIILWSAAIKVLESWYPSIVDVIHRTVGG